MISAYGFEKMRLPEIRQAIAADLKNRLLAAGLNHDIETRPDSVLGILIDTFAEREAALWENAQAVYNAMYPQSASGIALDRAVSFAGVVRHAASKSQARVICWGTRGVNIPAHSQVASADGTLWTTDNAVTLTETASAGLVLKPTANRVSLTINGTTYAFNGESTASVLNGIVSHFEASGISATHDGVLLTAQANDAVNRRFTNVSGLQIVEVGSSVAVSATQTGQIQADVNAINKIVSSVSGWLRVNNPQTAQVGQNAESDADLLARYDQGVYLLGAATLPSIAANIKNDVPQITEIGVFENTSDTADEFNRLPHSIHVIADGGDSEAIARAIWRYKAAGIDTNGQIVQEIQTDYGKQTIRFDRISPVFVWIDAVIELLPEAEQAFPVNGFNAIKHDLQTAGTLFGLGDDVLYQKLFYAVFNTQGVASVVLKIAQSSSPDVKPADSEFRAANLTIAPFAKAYFSLNRIEVR